MKQISAAHFNMIEACIQTAEANPGAWNALPGFRNTYESIRTTLLPELVKALAAASQKTVPATLLKAGKRSKLEATTRKIGLAVHALSDSEDDAIKDDAAISITALRRVSDMELVGIATKRLHLAQSIPGNVLEQWGILQNDLSLFAQSIEAYIEYATGTKVRRGEIKSSKGAVKSLIKEICRLFRKKLDTGVIILQDTQPEFYSKWFSARRIGARSHRTRSLVIEISSAGQPLSNAAIVLSNGLNRNSSARGVAWVQNLAPGSYTATVSAKDFAAKTVSFEVVAGQTSKVQVEMEV